jgi:predicted nucleotidyltransferase
MTVLLPEQVEALKTLRALCFELGVDMVIVGAIAYRVWTGDEGRTTEDVDVAVALDLDELPSLVEKLVAHGWEQDHHSEHRWITHDGARVDLLPIGKKARQDKQLTWPLGETRMSLVGFEHVFGNPTECELAPDLRVRVVPLPVWALLKIVSYLDSPILRQKDFEDLVRLMEKHEETDRRFSDDVLDADIDYEQAGAYLLGRDLGQLCVVADEVATVERFLRQVLDSERQMLIEREDLSAEGEEQGELRVARDLSALKRGFEKTRISLPS